MVPPVEIRGGLIEGPTLNSPKVHQSLPMGFRGVLSLNGIYSVVVILLVAKVPIGFCGSEGY